MFTVKTATEKNLLLQFPMPNALCPCYVVQNMECGVCMCVCTYMYRWGGGGY